jgi:hypothetical protein
MNRENHETPYGGPYVAQGKRLGAPKDQHIVFIVAILQHFLESVMSVFGKKPINHFAKINFNILY